MIDDDDAEATYARGPLIGRTICLDPGHPSENGRGTRGRKITEMRAAWRVALKTQALLRADGAAVLLTKAREDQTVTNRERAEIANRAGADLMVRLHCDAAGGSGTGTFYPDRMGTTRGKRGPARSVIDASRVAARRFHAAMMKELRGVLADRGVQPDTKTLIGSRQGALTGSIFSEVPVLLVEMCVLTSRRDDAFMASEAGQQRIAGALAAGVRAALTRP